MAGWRSRARNATREDGGKLSQRLGKGRGCHPSYVSCSDQPGDRMIPVCPTLVPCPTPWYGRRWLVPISQPPIACCQNLLFESCHGKDNGDHFQGCQ